MATINVTDLTAKLLAAGIPIQGVALDRPGKTGITIDFIEGENGATDEQKAAAQKIIDNYDQDVEDAVKQSDELTDADIDNAKTVADVKALLKKMRKA